MKESTASNYDNVWVEWVEPYSQATGSDPVYMKIKATTAIGAMKSYRSGKYSYNNDEDALVDFLTVHWAKLTEAK